MINKKWCDPRNISILSLPARLIWNTSPLSAAHSTCPGSLHRSSLLPSTFHLKQILAWLCPNSTTSSAATSTNTLTLHVSSPGTSTKPTSEKSCQTSTNIYPVQLEDRIHWIIATPSLKSLQSSFPACFWQIRPHAAIFLTPEYKQKDRSETAGGEGSDALVPPL